MLGFQWSFHGKLFGGYAHRCTRPNGSVDDIHASGARYYATLRDSTDPEGPEPRERALGLLATASATAADAGDGWVTTYLLLGREESRDAVDVVFSKLCKGDAPQPTSVTTRAGRKVDVPRAAHGFAGVYVPGMAWVCCDMSRVVSGLWPCEREWGSAPSRQVPPTCRRRAKAQRRSANSARTRPQQRQVS